MRTKKCDTETLPFSNAPDDDKGRRGHRFRWRTLSLSSMFSMHRFSGGCRPKKSPVGMILVLFYALTLALKTWVQYRSSVGSAIGTLASNQRTNNKTTIVLMGYSIERIQNFERILKAYGDMEEEVDRVLFVWNNKDAGPPNIPEKTKVPIKVLAQEHNEMNNRFGKDVSSRTSTDTVAMIDDDVLLSRAMLRTAIDAWYASSSRPIVGVLNDGRVASTQSGYHYPCSRIEGWIFLQWNCWNPLSVTEKDINLVIGKTMLFGSEYLERYQNNERIWSYTGKEKHFCEDILMNALIRDGTNSSPPILLRKTRMNKRDVLSERGGLSRNTKTLLWQGKRSECVKWASNYFGYDVWKEIH